MNTRIATCNGEVDDFYSFAQSFVGGAAIGYGGVTTYKKTSIKYLKLLERGTSNLALEFAHTDRDKFKKQYFESPLGVMSLVAATYTAAGLGEDVSSFLSKKKDYLTINDIDFSKVKHFSSFTSEYALNALSRGGFISYPDFKENKWVNKSIIIGFKSLFYSFVF